MALRLLCEGRIQPSCCTERLDIPGLITDRSAIKDAAKKLLAFSNPVARPYDYQSDKPVPKIVHYCWYGGKRRSMFRFYHFISILSAYKFIKPEVIYFWYDFIPQGNLWKDIRRRVPIIQTKHRPAPTHIYYRSLSRYDQHQSDIVRLEAVMEYGGIYMDLDVVALKSFDPLLKYDTTMGYETSDGLCNGIIISKPNAPFLRLWHLEYANFDDNSWAYHSVQLPAVLAKTYPGLIHTEENTLNRPNWLETEWLYEKGKWYNWSYNYAVHLYYQQGQNRIEHSPETIKKLDTTMGEIFRYIYYGSINFVTD
jgi:mannosyltransferase OCH1-like enzyme